jgi:hypothetical protein
MSKYHGTGCVPKLYRQQQQNFWFHVIFTYILYIIYINEQTFEQSLTLNKLSSLIIIVQMENIS